MIKKFYESRWWHLMAAVTSLATLGYVAYMAYAHHVIMVWYVMVSVFMTIYEFIKFVSYKKKHDVT